MSKSLLRQSLLSHRDQLSPAWRHEAEASVAKHLNHLINAPSRRIGSFLSVGSELNLTEWHQDLWSQGHSLYVPKIRSKTTMDLVHLPDAGHLIPGRFGIPTSQKDDAVDPSALDYLVMPLVGFTRDGKRLGMGGGFYDRYLEHVPKQKPLRIGVAFSIQALDTLAEEPWDQRLDVIVTEAEIIRP